MSTSNQSNTLSSLRNVSSSFDIQTMKFRPKYLQLVRFQSSSTASFTSFLKVCLPSSTIDMRLSQSISICYKLPHVTAHVTLHVTLKLLHFSMYFQMFPHVTATIYKKYIYFFIKSSSNMS